MSDACPPIANTRSDTNISPNISIETAHRTHTTQNTLHNEKKSMRYNKVAHQESEFAIDKERRGGGSEHLPKRNTSHTQRAIVCIVSLRLKAHLECGLGLDPFHQFSQKSNLNSAFRTRVAAIRFLNSVERAHRSDTRTDGSAAHLRGQGRADKLHAGDSFTFNPTKKL